MERENKTKLIAKQLIVEKTSRNDLELKSYKSLIKGLGAMIIQNGLYGTLVFLKAKGENKTSKKHYHYVFEDIKHFLNEKGLFSNNDILEYLERTENLSEIQERVLELVNWYRRYVEIFISDED
ncbi:CRISPR-associated protein Cmr5 [Thermosipho melanesiensis]|uniref:CRISPR type III-B/RAMP module-associated protein Cmr5 n=2 Tax=Thermosipho melanesiensis TaxID=46541 RepID=A6LNK4_THEM4|nr:type III-B CRISPR module-associated protein Cmr5 [Thermosipho melanesiensis]ABR31505.1 CRISPR-associated protein, Cmr5 family [Thermosipho melanesiensis BI429]APT74558.1 CRISPR-associated protein Cmr5 [Thermosipho melanesiensis]OOC35473.1 CRISPR-associated protein Cmr5 [Thermosipho melanesiensis]OOC36510.1 CRISPR-associated protein Cmr5 [Thermosipho melanesiensis]OOC36833.1 CRISPR-associated protein Cmr5 [Thermosipho melanesiensis]